MADPAISRAKIEIASDEALIKRLMSEELQSGLPRSAKARARFAALDRLIAANRALLERLKT